VYVDNKGDEAMAEAMAEVRIEDTSAPPSFKQRLGIGMAMVATAFPHGLNEDEARGGSRPAVQ
jgi:hypothetical protein